ncbi:hypothetical protein HUJ04_001611 [Dendroctonus ponderosae]|nr:hypothetical protein HUJ04_001611 [Dendroctonus ponderosae]
MYWKNVVCYEIFYKMDERDTFEDLYFNIITSANELLEISVQEKSSNISGSYEAWTFFRIYESVIHNTSDLSKIQNFDENKQTVYNHFITRNSIYPEWSNIFIYTIYKYTYMQLVRLPSSGYLSRASNRLQGPAGPQTSSSAASAPHSRTSMCRRPRHRPLPHGRQSLLLGTPSCSSTFPFRHTVHGAALLSHINKI